MHGTLGSLPWTTDRVDLLRDLVESRMSAAFIAVRLGVTRGSVMGKAFRLGLELNSNSPRNYKVRRDLKERGLYVPAAKNASTRKLRSRPFVAKLAPKEAPSPVVPLNLTFDEIRDDQCRFIVTADHPFLFCGHAKDGSSSYCSHHHYVTVQHG